MQIVFLSPTSVTIEMVNKSPYFSERPFDVYLDDKLVLSNVKTNVFSLYHLERNTEYKIKVEKETLKFRTLDYKYRIDVCEYGAIPDGVFDNTKVLQTIIHGAPKETLIYFKPGVYFTGPLFLKNDLMIEIDKDAVILGKTDRKEYPILKARVERNDGSILEQSSWEGTPADTFASIFTGVEVSNVKIFGEGIIDCNAQNSDWWINHKQMRGGAWRPKGIFLSNSQHIGLQGITVKNTPSWNLHPYFSDHLEIIDVKLISPHDSPNTDGCNPESCSHVTLIGVNFSVGDDCIAIKSGKFEMGMKYRRPTEKMVVRNCYFAHGHGAVVLGSETSGGVKDLTVEKCYFYQTDRGLRIKTRRGRGESMQIDGIVFENIIMDEVKVPLVMNMYYFCDDDGKTEYVWSKKALAKDERTPYLGSFTFRNIKAKNAHAAAGFFYGLPEQPIESITLENVDISFSEDAKEFTPAMMSYLDPQVKMGLQFREVNNVLLKNVTLTGQIGEKVILENVKSFEEI